MRKRVTRKGRPFYPLTIPNPMNPKLLPILSRIIARDIILSSFDANNLPQAALAYVRGHYLNDNFIWLTPDEQDCIETLPPFADNLRESIRPAGGIGNPDSSVYHLFGDGSLWLKTNAYSSVWADARDYVVEIILPRMELSRMEAELLRAIGMDEPLANARLIATAPDLLAALERLAHPMADDDDLDYAREVIAKAKGGQQ